MNVCIHSSIHLQLLATARINKTKGTALNYRAIPLSFSSLLASVSFPFSARSFHSFSPLPCGSNCVQQLTLSLSLLHAIAYVHSMPTIVCFIQADFIDSLSSVDVTGFPKKWICVCKLCIVIGLLYCKSWRMDRWMDGRVAWHIRMSGTFFFILTLLLGDKDHCLPLTFSILFLCSSAIFKCECNRYGAFVIPHIFNCPHKYGTWQRRVFVFVR